MKTSMKLFVLCSLVCLAGSAVSAQQKTRRKSGAAPAICKVQSVPRGMVIVGQKANAACSQGVEFIVKRPGAKEIVCDGSPIPDGYVVEERTGSMPCRGDNPLTNALLIKSTDITTGGDSFYGIKIGMSKFQVEDILGSPADVSRGTVFNPGKGTTWVYNGRTKTTLIYFDENFNVMSFEERVK